MSSRTGHPQLAETTSVRYSPLQALRTSVDQLTGMVSALPQVLQSATQHGGQGVSGPIGIAHITTRMRFDDMKTLLC